MASKLVNDAPHAVERRSFAERLQAAVERAGGVSAVAKATDVPVSTFHTWVNGTAEPKITVIARISSYLGVSLDALVSGLESQTAQADNQRDESVFIPMLNVVGAAGAGTENQREFVISELPFSPRLLRELGVKPQNAHFIRAKGDSMEPTIGDGSIVLIDTGRSNDREDGIFALMVGEDVRIKRLAFSTIGGLAVMSDNPAYPDETFGRGEIDQVKIVGKVVWVGGVV